MRFRAISSALNTTRPAKIGYDGRTNTSTAFPYAAVFLVHFGHDFPTIKLSVTIGSEEGILPRWFHARSAERGANEHGRRMTFVYEQISRRNRFR